MKVYSIHFVLKGKSSYKNLAPVFPDMLKMFLEEIGQMQEDEEVLQMLIELNMMDLERDRKPEGYNRKAKYRLIFPIDNMEFYIRSFTAKPADLLSVAERVGAMLSAAGIR